MRAAFAGSVVAFLLACPALAQNAEKAAVELHSEVLVAGLPLPESKAGVYWVGMEFAVDQQGAGAGTLQFDPNPPAYDEFGFRATGGDSPFIKLECTLKPVKRKKLLMNVVPGRQEEVEYVLYQIQGPKITSRLYLATESGALQQWAHLLVHDDQGKVRYMVPVRTTPPFPPCHPGCFPAGTAVRTPEGAKAIQTIREQDLVTTLTADGKRTSARVTGIFVTRNRLLNVQVEGAVLVTTATQPMALEAGGFRPAGELQAGDRIWRWTGDERRAAVVQSVVPADREAQVFNLILAEQTTFIAGDFVVRSKPPVDPLAP